MTKIQGAGIFSSHKTLNSVGKKICEEPNILIRVVEGPDDICLPCEHWDINKGYCVQEPDNQPELYNLRMEIDKKAMEALGLNQGEALTALNLFRLVGSRVTKEIFIEKICYSCPNIVNCKEMYEQKLEATIRRLSVE